MRAKIILAATGAALTVSALNIIPAGATLTTSKRCDGFGGQTVVANSVSRIYQAQYIVNDEENVIGVGVYRCRPGSTATAETIAKYPSTNEIPRVYPITGTLRGKYLLLEYVDESSSVKHTLRLYDLAAKKYLARYDRTGSSAISDYLASGGGFGVLTTKGLAAFDSSGARLAAAAGASEVGTGINTLYWRSGSTVTGTTLSGPPSGTLSDPS